MEHSLDIFRNDIEFQVHVRSGLQVMQVGEFPRMRDDPDHEASRENVRNGKTDSIDRDRPLGSHIMSGVFRQFDFESKVCAFRPERDNGRNAINVALNEMSADAAVGP